MICSMTDCKLHITLSGVDVLLIYDVDAALDADKAKSPFTTSKF